MYDSELFYFSNLSNVCVYTNFIETINIIVRRFHSLSTATDTKQNKNQICVI